MASASAASAANGCYSGRGDSSSAVASEKSYIVHFAKFGAARKKGFTTINELTVEQRCERSLWGEYAHFLGEEYTTKANKFLVVESAEQSLGGCIRLARFLSESKKTVASVLFFECLSADSTKDQVKWLRAVKGRIRKAAQKRTNMAVVDGSAVDKGRSKAQPCLPNQLFAIAERWYTIGGSEGTFNAAALVTSQQFCPRAGEMGYVAWESFQWIPGLQQLHNPDFMEMKMAKKKPVMLVAGIGPVQCPLFGHAAAWSMNGGPTYGRPTASEDALNLVFPPFAKVNLSEVIGKMLTSFHPTQGLAKHKALFIKNLPSHFTSKSIRSGSMTYGFMECSLNQVLAVSGHAAEKEALWHYISILPAAMQSVFSDNGTLESLSVLNRVCVCVYVCVRP